jgi:Rrf2 family protein
MGLATMSTTGGLQVAHGDPAAVSHRLDYAVRALVALARTDAPMTAQQIATAEQLPRPYLLTLLRELTTHGLLHSRRGRRGGFALARRPTDVSVADVMTALAGDAEVHLNGNQAEAPPGSALPQVWTDARDAADEVLRSVTIADLLADVSRPAPRGR